MGAKGVHGGGESDVPPTGASYCISLTFHKYFGLYARRDPGLPPITLPEAATLFFRFTHVVPTYVLASVSTQAIVLKCEFSNNCSLLQRLRVKKQH